MQSLGFLYHTAEHKFGDLSLPKADMLMFFLSRKGYRDRQEMVRWNRYVYFKNSDYFKKARKYGQITG